MKKVLKPNCFIVLETINPLSIYALTHSFFADPDHELPVHPSTLTFLARTAGFTDVKIQFLHPVPYPEKLHYAPEEGEAAASINRVMNENSKKLNSFIYADQDYALIAHKEEREKGPSRVQY